MSLKVLNWSLAWNIYKGHGRNTNLVCCYGNSFKTESQLFLDFSHVLELWNIYAPQTTEICLWNIFIYPLDMFIRGTGHYLAMCLVHGRVKGHKTLSQCLQFSQNLLLYINIFTIHAFTLRENPTCFQDTNVTAWTIPGSRPNQRVMWH